MRVVLRAGVRLLVMFIEGRIQGRQNNVWIAKLSESCTFHEFGLLSLPIGGINQVII